MVNWINLIKKSLIRIQSADGEDDDEYGAYNAYLAEVWKEDARQAAEEAETNLDSVMKTVEKDFDQAPFGAI